MWIETGLDHAGPGYPPGSAIKGAHRDTKRIACHSYRAHTGSNHICNFLGMDESMTTECLVIAEGADARCPLCGRIVYVGTRHECDGSSSEDVPLKKPSTSVAAKDCEESVKIKPVEILFIVLCFLWFFGAALFAETPKTPAIPDALKAQFFQAQASMIAANATAQAKRQAFSEVLGQVNKICGEGFQANTDSEDNLTCIPSPKPPAPPIGKPEPKRP